MKVKRETGRGKDRRGGWVRRERGNIETLRERRSGERKEKKEKWWTSRGEQEGGREEY